MASQWFYQTSEGQQSGPVDSRELRRLAEAGIIRPDTPVRKGVDGRWVTAEKVRGLFQPSASAPQATGRQGGGPPGGRGSDSSLDRQPPSPPPMKPQPMPTTFQRGLVDASAEPTEPGGNKIDRERMSVPYGLLFAWGWTLLFGALLLFCVEQDRYGLAALSPQNLLVTIAYLSPSILILAGPTLPAAIAEWRRSKSPVAGSLIAVLVLIIALLIAKVCRPPEVVPGFGWLGRPPRREEVRESISRIEDRYDKFVSQGMDESSKATGKEISSAEAKAPGIVGEVERFLMESMDVAAEVRNDYVRELETIGWYTILDANRLRDDNKLTESRALLEKAKGVVQRHRARTASLLQTVKSKIPNLSVDPDTKAKMLFVFDKSAKTWQPKMDMIWELEAKTISEFEKIIDLLEARAGSWSVVDERLIFQDRPDADKYNALLSRIQQYVAEQERIREQAQEASKSGFARMKQF